MAHGPLLSILFADKVGLTLSSRVLLALPRTNPQSIYLFAIKVKGHTYQIINLISNLIDFASIIWQIFINT